MPHDDPCDNFDGAFDQWEPRTKPKLTELELDTLRTVNAGSNPYGFASSRVITQAIQRLRRKGMLHIEPDTLCERVTADGLEALERAKGSRR